MAKLEPYPYKEIGGATDASAVRMLKMVAPYCPIESNPFRQTGRPGEQIPNPHYTGEMNCQIAHKINNQGKWDVSKCEAAGHEPFYFNQSSTIVENIVEPDGTITGQRQKILGDRKLNVVQVETGIRYASDTTYQLALARGYKHLEEFGITSPCEYRNCYESVRVTTRYGRYCGGRHARLIAADRRKLAFPIAGQNDMDDDMFMEWEEKLDSINIDEKSV